MTQDDGAFKDEVTNTPPLPVVHVAPTNSSLLYVNSHVMLVPKLRNLTVLERDVLNRLQYEGRVLYC